MLVATRIGVFDALVAGARTADQVAARLGTRPDTTRKLLNFLVTQDYLRLTDGRYSLSRTGRKWLPASSSRSLHDSILMRFVEWGWLDNLEEVVRTGDGVDVHHRMAADQWGLYQRSMRSTRRTKGCSVFSENCPARRNGPACSRTTGPVPRPAAPASGGHLLVSWRAGLRVRASSACCTGGGASGR